MGLEEVIGAGIGAAIQAGGTVGSAFLIADATKSTAKQQANAAIQVALSQERAQLVAEQAQVQQAAISRDESTVNTKTIVVAAVLIAFGSWLLGPSEPRRNPAKKRKKRRRP